MIKISIFGDNIFLLSLVQIKMLEAGEDKKRLYYNKFHSTISSLAVADPMSVVISAEKYGNLLVSMSIRRVNMDPDR